jgi:hypothetical protein
MIEDWLVGIVVVLVTKMLNSSIDQKDAGSEIFDLSQSKLIYANYGHSSLLA